MPTRLLLFGAPEIHVDGESFVLPGERRAQLLAFLAQKRAWVNRAEVAALFWPEQPARLAYANLRKTLFRLQSLRWAPAIEIEANLLRCDAATDTGDFEAAIRDGRLEDALAQRRGDFLEGFAGDGSDAWASWLAFERDRLRAAWRATALQHLEAGLEPVRAVALSAQLLDDDPLDEPALRAHLAALARNGQAAQARRAYREYAQRLADELHLTPSASIAALHASLSAVAAPGRDVPATAPQARDDGFVGRSVELRRLGELLARDDCRLVSITGPGGVGKTRLAQRLLDTRASDDEAVFVSLEGAAAPGEFGARLAQALALPPAAAREPLAQALAHLAPRRMLLVLDNFEELVPHKALVTQVLAAAPAVRVVVTSRVRLGVPGEWLLPLAGLPCPEPEDEDRAEAFDAVRLFVQAAQRVEPALVPAGEAAAIVEICRRVEGLPLALQLAAAWTRVLSCAAIAEELAHGTALLRADDPANGSKHASIEAVFDQSWRLLTAKEQAVLARLSLFRGSFTAEAARAVAGAALPVLGALVDKSLLQKEGERLHLHPLVAQLAATRLGEAARADAERALADFFAHLVGQLAQAVSLGETAALQRVELELDNVRAGWRHALARGTGAGLRPLANALSQFCQHRGRYGEGLALMTEGLAGATAAADRRLESQLLALSAQFAYRLDRYDDAQARATRALAMARELRDDEIAMMALQVLGTCALRTGRHDEARRCFTKVLALAPEAAMPRTTAVMLDHLALIEKGAGRYDEAVALSLRSLVLHRRLASAGAEALCLNNLGSLYSDRGDEAAAEAHLREALAVCERHGLTATKGHVLANLAGVATKTGRYAEAAQHAAAAADVAATTGNRLLTGWLAFQRSTLATRLGDLADARAQLAAGMTLALQVGAPSLYMNGLDAFCDLLEATGEAAAALRVAAFAAAHPDARTLERQHFSARIPEGQAPLSWPGMSLPELAHRLVIERDAAYAPLVAALRRP